MSKFDDKMIVVGNKLITKFGRNLTLVKYSNASLDSDRPWKGTVDVVGGIVVRAVVVPPAAVRVFGLTALGDATEFLDMLEKSQKIIIIGQIPGGHSIKEFHAVKDDGQDWGILATQILKPGEVTLLNYIGVTR